MKFIQSFTALFLMVGTSSIPKAVSHITKVRKLAHGTNKYYSTSVTKVPKTTALALFPISKSSKEKKQHFTKSWGTKAPKLPTLAPTHIPVSDTQFTVTLTGTVDDSNCTDTGLNQMAAGLKTLFDENIGIPTEDFETTVNCTCPDVPESSRRLILTTAVVVIKLELVNPCLLSTVRSAAETVAFQGFSGTTSIDVMIPSSAPSIAPPSYPSPISSPSSNPSLSNNPSFIPLE